MNMMPVYLYLGLSVAVGVAMTAFFGDYQDHVDGMLLSREIKQKTNKYIADQCVAAGSGPLSADYRWDAGRAGAANDQQERYLDSEMLDKTTAVIKPQAFPWITIEAQPSAGNEAKAMRAQDLAERSSFELSGDRTLRYTRHLGTTDPDPTLHKQELLAGLTSLDGQDRCRNAPDQAGPDNLKQPEFVTLVEDVLRCSSDGIPCSTIIP